MRAEWTAARARLGRGNVRPGSGVIDANATGNGCFMNAPAAVLYTSDLLPTTAMVGLMWFVQVMHDALSAAVGSDGFVRYELLHQRRTSLVVGPLMAVQVVSS